MGIILVIAYGIIVSCGAAHCIIELKLKRTSAITAMLSKIFNFSNIWFAILIVVYCTMEIFFRYTGIRTLICAGILVIISFIITKIREPSIFSNGLYNGNSMTPGWEYKAAFNYIDIYQKITNINVDILNHLYDREKIFHEQTDKTVGILDTAVENLNSYLLLQKEDCSLLLTSEKKCVSLFNELEYTATISKNSFTNFTSKLDYSSAAIQYCGESEKLLKDINLSFKDAFTQNRVMDEDMMKKIETIMSILHTLIFKCSSIQSFPKTYISAIDMYSVKMESTMKSFEDNIKKKQADISKLCSDFSKAVIDENEVLHNTLKDTMIYLHKNIFVLTKILETYKNAGVHKRELKKLLQQYESVL